MHHFQFDIPVLVIAIDVLAAMSQEKPTAMYRNLKIKVKLKIHHRQKIDYVVYRLFQTFNM